MSRKWKGILLAGFGGSMWGFSDIFAQLLFRQHAVPSEWLVSTRLLIAGVLVLLYSRYTKKEDIWVVFKDRGDLSRLLVFSLVGMVSVQFFFYKTIELSSASLATILQFIAPIFVYGYLVLRKEKRLKVTELSIILLCFFGVFLILTNGNFTKLAVTLGGFMMGIISAIALAFYSLQPRAILAKYHSTVIVGWGMTIAGLAFQFVHPIWRPEFTLTGDSFFLLAGIIILGTAIGFVAYMTSLTYIDASLASIVTALEPLLAAVLSVFVFNQVFGMLEVIGIIIVIVTVLLLSSYSNRKETTVLVDDQLINHI